MNKLKLIIKNKSLKEKHENKIFNKFIKNNKIMLALSEHAKYYKTQNLLFNLNNLNKEKLCENINLKIKIQNKLINLYVEHIELGIYSDYYYLATNENLSIKNQKIIFNKNQYAILSNPNLCKEIQIKIAKSNNYDLIRDMIDEQINENNKNICKEAFDILLMKKEHNYNLLIASSCASEKIQEHLYYNVNDTEITLCLCQNNNLSETLLKEILKLNDSYYTKELMHSDINLEKITKFLSENYQ